MLYIYNIYIYIYIHIYIYIYNTILKLTKYIYIYISRCRWKGEISLLHLKYYINMEKNSTAYTSLKQTEQIDKKMV